MNTNRAAYAFTKGAVNLFPRNPLLAVLRTAFSLSQVSASLLTNPSSAIVGTFSFFASPMVRQFTLIVCLCRLRVMQLYAVCCQALFVRRLSVSHQSHRKRSWHVVECVAVLSHTDFGHCFRPLFLGSFFRWCCYQILEFHTSFLPNIRTSWSWSLVTFWLNIAWVQCDPQNLMDSSLTISSSTCRYVPHTTIQRHHTFQRHIQLIWSSCWQPKPCLKTALESEPLLAKKIQSQ